MTKHTVEGYLRWIAPTAGDPTYSLLKAHLLFDDLLRAYLTRTLPHASALEDARLTFAQTLAVARASSKELPPDHWIWKAIGDLNRIRNLLSHETEPKDLAKKCAAYRRLITESMKIPLPEPLPELRQEPSATNAHLFSALDMVTMGLYYHTAARLGFDLQHVFAQEEQRLQENQRHAATGGRSSKGSSRRRHIAKRFEFLLIEARSLSRFDVERPS